MRSLSLALSLHLLLPPLFPPSHLHHVCLTRSVCRHTCHMWIIHLGCSLHRNKMSLSSVLSADAIDGAIKECQGIIFCYYRCCALRSPNNAAFYSVNMIRKQEWIEKHRYCLRWCPFHERKESIQCFNKNYQMENNPMLKFLQSLLRSSGIWGDFK